MIPARPALPRSGLPGTVLLALALAAGAPAPAAPASPRHQDLPPAGRSLFDHAVAHDADGRPLARLPFPFSALVEHLAGRVGGMSAAGVRQVLIPLGRSLQRSAAAPRYFDHPRVVVAFDGGRSGADGLFLKDRLYLGYQDAAALIEVISYNEEAARFEFQVVHDYRAGADADVRYANRSLCLACHQNEAPLFARPLWSETNANPQVAALLARRAATFHGVPAHGGVDIAQAVDDATDRANRFAAWQMLWRDGCGARPGAASQCRRDVLVLALARRLGVTGAIEPESSRLAAALHAAWPIHWPQGLAVADADLPDRDPFRALARRHGTLTVGAVPGADGDRLVQELMARNTIPSRLEPLEPRAGGERLQSSEIIDGGRFVAGIAGFFSVDDVAWLDDALAARRQIRSGEVREVELDCRLAAARQAGGRRRLSARCAGAEGGDALHARLYLSGGKVQRGLLEHLSLDGGRQVGLVLGAFEERVAGGKRQLVASPRRRHDGLRAWLASGDVVQRVEFAWTADGAAIREPGDARVRLQLVDGTRELREAVAGVVAASAGDPDAVLAPGAMRRVRVMAALAARLADAPRRWCCRRADGLPAARPDRPGEDMTLAHIGDAGAEFIAHCGQCHRSQDASPPNFLSGDASEVERGIAQCAERIHYRLATWHRDTRDPATPMPPVSALRARGRSAAQWKSSPALVSMRAHVRRLLEGEPEAGADRPETLLAQAYATLRPCLASAARRGRSQEGGS